MKLKREDFTVLAYVADVMSRIAYFAAPANYVFTLRDKDPFSMFLVTKEDFTGLTPDASNEIPITNGTIVDSDVLGDDGGACVAYETTSATPVRIAITAINYVTNTVTVTMPAAKTAARLYYIFKEGEAEIRQEAPEGSSSIFVPLWNGRVEDLHTLNQLDREVNDLFKLGKSCLLAPDFRFALWLNSSVVVDWNALALNARLEFFTLRLPRYRFPADLEKRILEALTTKA